ncbi:hypothetical protein ACSZN6_21820, partial [Aeromonas hydrophila]
MASRAPRLSPSSSVSGLSPSRSRICCAGSSSPGYYWATRFNDTRKVFAFAPENLPQNAETSVDR